MVDGATEAYDSIRWVDQLVESFLGVDPAGGAAVLTPDAMDAWFGRDAGALGANAPARSRTIFEERKFHDEGSFATLLGCEIAGLDGHWPRWQAVALGDTVLFHVRGHAAGRSSSRSWRPTTSGLDPGRGLHPAVARGNGMRARLDPAER